MLFFLTLLKNCYINYFYLVNALRLSVWMNLFDTGLDEILKFDIKTKQATGNICKSSRKK